MLRPIGPEALAGLRRAAVMTDVALDLALMRAGILAPVELSEIRLLLLRPELELSAVTNREGHCVVEFVEHDAVVASLHPDGRVVHRDYTAA
jgi:hypothetical protein